MKKKAWLITANGHTFYMIDPKGCNEAEALKEVRARWPEAKIVRDGTHCKAADIESTGK